jgi:hypothetical protein
MWILVPGLKSDVRIRSQVLNSTAYTTKIINQLHIMPDKSLAAASASAMPEGVTDPNYRPLPGRLGNLSIPQQHALEKFKRELIAEGVFVEERMDDAMLLRCVVSRIILRC